MYLFKKNIFSNHSLLVIYSLVFIGLCFGVFVTSGFDFFGFLAIYTVSFVFFYILSFLIRKKSGDFLNRKAFFSEQLKVRISWVLLFLCLSVILFRLSQIGWFPLYKISTLDTFDDIARFRESITNEDSVVLRYLSSFIVKGFLPFLILFSFAKNHRVFYWIVLFVGVYYATALLQKSFIMVVLIPALVYALGQKKWWYVLKYLSIILFCVFAITKLSNPEIKVSNSTASEHTEVFEFDNLPEVEDRQEQNMISKIQVLAGAISKRVFITPGEVVSFWFENIPEKKPYLNGDGYRWLAGLKGTEYRAYAYELFEIMYPEKVKKGLTGSVNVASFMYDFANFGWIGLVLAGFLLAILLNLLEAIFQGNQLFKLSMNIYPILFLSSSALPTMLFSGGWFLQLLLYFTLLKESAKD